MGPPGGRSPKVNGETNGSFRERGSRATNGTPAADNAKVRSDLWAITSGWGTLSQQGYAIYRAFACFSDVLSHLRQNISAEKEAVSRLSWQ